MHVEKFGKFCFCLRALFPLRITEAFQLSSGPLGVAAQRDVVPLDWVPPTEIRKPCTQTDIMFWLHTIF